MNEKPEVANVFPRHIVDKLVQAAARPKSFGKSRLIEEAIAKAKRECPELFRPEREID